MDDLIIRQKDIKAIEELHDCYNGFSDTYDKACIIGVLEEVPSIQPEVIRCKDCAYWNAESRECSSPNYPDGYVTPAGFYCGWAERRNDE